MDLIHITLFVSFIFVLWKHTSDMLLWRAVLAEGCATAAFVFFLTSVRKRRNGAYSLRYSRVQKLMIPSTTLPSLVLGDDGVYTMWFVINDRHG